MARYELTPIGDDNGNGRGNGNGDGPHSHPAHGHGWSPPYAGGEVDETIHLRDVLGVLRRHVVLVVGIAGVVAAAAGYLVLTSEDEYRARAVLRLQDERGAMTGGIDNAAVEQVMGKTNDPLLSELEVLRSRSVALEVIRRTPVRLVPLEGEFPAGALAAVDMEPDVAEDTLELRFAPEGYQVSGAIGAASAAYGAPVTLAGLTFTVPRRPAETESARLALLGREEGIDRLLTNLVARPREKTDVVDVEFTSADPRLSQQVVNTTVEAFSTLNADAAQESSRRRRIFLQEQLQQTDSVLAAAQVALSDFQKRETVFSSRAKFEAQQTGLMGIEVRREEMAADRQMYQGLLTNLTRARTGRGRVETLVSAPGIAANPVVAQLYTQLIQYQTTRDSMSAAGAAETNPDLRRVDGLIASTETKLISAARSHVEALDARIAALDGLRGRSEAELQGLPDAEAEEMRLLQGVETARKLADQLREEFQKARIAEAVEVGQVEIVDMAALPSAPIGSGRSMKLALGLVLGLMLGSGGAFLREHMNTRIRRREDVEETLHVPGLAIIPSIGRRAGGNGRIRLPIRIANHGALPAPRPTVDELVTVSDLRSAGAEAFRTLRTNLMFSQSVHAIRTLVVTSATPGEGKTTTAANLAVTFAQQGLRVLLIDCDLRKARLHRVFQVPQEPGLTELVLGYKAPGEAIRATSVDGLSILTSGTLPPNPAELLGGARMKKALELLGQTFDMIVLDTPPLMAATDASILGVRADGVLMVVRAGQTERGAAQQALQQLASVGARVVGAVLNDPDAEAQRYGNYYYNYDYYGDEAKVGR